MFDKVFKGLLGLAVSTLGAAALAAPVEESGDAGALPASAQVLPDLGAVSGIAGRIAAADDVDMFRFEIGAAATLSFLAGAGRAIDSQFFLFDADGAGLWANDDMGTSLDAEMTVPLAAGTYYLAVAAWERRPLEAGGLPIFGEAGGMLLPPLNPGIVSAWSGAGGIGEYTIEVSIAPVPEPATWLLTSAGIAALLGRRALRARRKGGAGIETAAVPA